MRFAARRHKATSMTNKIGTIFHGMKERDILVPLKNKSVQVVMRLLIFFLENTNPIKVMIL